MRNDFKWMIKFYLVIFGICGLVFMSKSDFILIVFGIIAVCGGLYMAFTSGGNDGDIGGRDSSNY